MDLAIDWERVNEYPGKDGHVTGIFVRAKGEDGRWRSVDIAWLTKQSLLSFLKSRGGDNPWAENTVGILLGHGMLHEPVEKEDERISE
jgi:hypothetical protein